MIDWGQYPNFRAAEFDCRCCGRNEMNAEFLGKLQLLRSAYGKPMHVSSGYRCPNHPIEKAKSAPGMHAAGMAADITVNGADGVELLRLALNAGFTGIGVQQKGIGRFLHLDTRSTPALWSY